MFSSYLLHFFPFMTEREGKTCFSAKKMIMLSEWRAEHAFVGRNTQQLLQYKQERFEMGFKTVG